MDFKITLKMPRIIVMEVTDEKAKYNTEEYEILLNGEVVMKTDKVINSLYDLEPETEYEITVRRGEEQADVQKVTTPFELTTLNVKDFGAKGDGVTDDTHFIQTAIMCCPKDGRVYIPEGTYKFTNILLKSDLVLELAKGAVLSAFVDKTRLPILPGRVAANNEHGEYLIGSWEGDPLDSYLGIVSGFNAENITICGQGVIDGSADFDNWWDKEKRKDDPARRPKMLFLNNCKNFVLQGVEVNNSPAWNLHPYFSDNLRFIDISLQSPPSSHNTDGLDPESCNNVEIAGVYFSVGDDCIAIKSGKIYMGKTYKTPSQNFVIRNCYMKSGHGAVTFGSENGAGIKNITVKNCIFSHTDRGVRLKTRRGRGEDSVLEKLYFEDIVMDHVQTPFVVNSFYYCGDGRTPYVADKNPLPIDERTPYVGDIYLRRIECKNTHVRAVYFYGLPERKISYIEMEDVKVSYAENAREGKAAMMEGCDRTCRAGVFVKNVEKLVMKNVKIEGCEGPEFEIDGVDEQEIQ